MLAKPSHKTQKNRLFLEAVFKDPKGSFIYLFFSSNVFYCLLVLCLAFAFALQALQQAPKQKSCFTFHLFYFVSC